MIVVNATKQTVLADRCCCANSFWERLVGLLNRQELAVGEGLLLGRCQGIHTVGMRFAIDIISIDSDFRVVRIINNLTPFRACVLNRAVYVVELPAGTVERTRTMVDDQIHISNNRPDFTYTSGHSHHPPAIAMTLSGKA